MPHSRADRTVSAPSQRRREGRTRRCRIPFGDKPTRVTYDWMYGPRRERSCTDVHVAAEHPMPLWNILDLTPEGRGADWYPKLEYEAVPRKPA